MKFPILALGLLSFSAVSVVAMPSKAQTSCPGAVGVIVPTQVAVYESGSEVEQHSESNFGAAPGCLGSTAAIANTQVYAGNEGDITQTQENNLFLGGGSEPSGYPNEYPEGFDPIFIEVPTTVDVEIPEQSFQDYYGPSHDAYS